MEMRVETSVTWWRLVRTWTPRGWSERWITVVDGQDRLTTVLHQPRSQYPCCSDR